MTMNQQKNGGLKMANVTRTKGKRLQKKTEMNKLNRTALMIGGAAAGGILLLMVASFLL